MRPVPEFASVRVTDPVDRGLRQYAVTGVGMYTLTYDASGHSPDGAYVAIVYGRWDGSGWPHASDYPDAPKVNGVRLAGGATVAVEKAITAHRDQDPIQFRWGSQVACRRWSPSRFAGAGQAPDATRARNAQIVAALIEDFTTRADAADHMTAHRLHHAPERLAKAQREVATIRAEIAAWEARLTREVAIADEQVAILHNEPPVTVPVSVPRGTSQAITREGEWHLRTSA